MDIFLYYFNIEFPCKRVKSSELINTRWLTCGDTHKSFHLLPFIPFHLTALLSLPVPQSTNTDLVNCSLTTTANHSLTPSFSVYFHKQRKRPTARVLHPTSHTYQLCQPANGRADWSAGDRNKRSPFGPMRFIHSLGTDNTHQERTHQDRRPDCPAT